MHQLASCLVDWGLDFFLVAHYAPKQNVETDQLHVGDKLGIEFWLEIVVVPHGFDVYVANALIISSHFRCPVHIGDNPRDRLSYQG